MKNITLKLCLSCLAGTAVLIATSSHAAGIDNLLPHRAVYDLKLKEASDRSGITGMNGRIVYEITGSKCDGFAVRFRFLTKVRTQRKSFTNDQRSTSFESGDGLNFSFVQQSFLNGQKEMDLHGKAERTAKVTKVELTKPNEDSVNLGPSIFMTEHMGRLIDAAHRKETIVTANIYDASEDGVELMETTAIIGKIKNEVLSVEGEDEKLSTLFKGKAAWPVSVSYFSASNKFGGGEKLPVYSVSFLMHESGVSRNLKMQYADYSLKGDLKEIEFLKVDNCD